MFEQKYLDWAVQPIWFEFEKYRNKKKTDKIQKKKKNKKRKPNKPNTKQIQQTHHIFFFAWCYLVWAVQPIWFEKSTNKKKTNEIQKGTNHNKKTKESKQIPKKQKTNKKKTIFHEIS